MFVRIRDRVERRMQRWIRARQGIDPDPVTLSRGRIYILPTRMGVVYGVLLFGMLLGSMNYSNSMGFMLTFLLTALALLAMHHAHGNLLGLTVARGRTDPVFAGQHAVFRLSLGNPTPRLRWAIGARSGDEPAHFLDIPPSGNALMPLPVPAVRRGRLKLARTVLFTRHPLGLFHAWVVLHMEYETLVYPAPAERAPPHPVAAGDGEGKRQGKGQDDFSGLVEYRGNESLRHIAWKAVARNDELLVKHFEGALQASAWFDFDTLDGHDTEERLSILCRWVVDADRDGIHYGLRLPGRELAPSAGDTHRNACLEALALYGEGS